MGEKLEESSLGGGGVKSKTFGFSSITPRKIALERRKLAGSLTTTFSKNNFGFFSNFDFLEGYESLNSTVHHQFRKR